MTTSEKSASALISLDPLRRPFLTKFLRWEWFLVALIALVVIVGSKRALAIAVKNGQTSERHTGLAARLRPAVS